MSNWRETVIGSETVLAGRLAGAETLFGVGVPSGASDREGRARALLTALAPHVRAVRWCTQIHGRLLASLSSEPGRPLSGAAPVGRCDGLITDEPGIALAVVTADCVPILATGGGVVTAVHAGWRGAAAGIVPRALDRLRAEYGVAADRLCVALGPAVGACHYQVGPEVVAALSAAHDRSGAWLDGDRVDLRTFLAEQLTQLGVAEDRILRVGGCTACDERMASYRRDGKAAGRQWSMVYLAAPDSARLLPLS